MKKKIILVLVLLLVLVTGCGKSNLKEIKLSDKEFGYTTTFSYPEKEVYTEPEEDHSGKTTEITFKNEELDLEFEMYYIESRKATYDNLKKSRSEKKYFNEYKFGDYEAYMYGEYSSGAYLNILLEDENDMAKAIFVSVSRLDTKEEVVVADVVNDKKVQELFKSIKVKKEK